MAHARPWPPLLRMFDQVEVPVANVQHFQWSFRLIEVEQKPGIWTSNMTPKNKKEDKII